MTIRLDKVTIDAQGFPVVSWEEDRNIFAPDGFGPARVACFIRPDKKTKELMFVAAGTVRHGPFEEERSWRLLHDFEIDKAEHHYWSDHERVAMEWLKGKNKLGGLVLTDGAHVLLANFRDDRSSAPMHINCALARPVEVAELHDRLRREFIQKREGYVRESLYGEYVWKGKKKFKAFVLPEPVKLPPWANWLANALVAIVLGIMAWVFYELLPR